MPIQLRIHLFIFFIFLNIPILYGMQTEPDYKNLPTQNLEELKPKLETAILKMISYPPPEINQVPDEFHPFFGPKFKKPSISIDDYLKRFIKYL